MGNRQFTIRKQEVIRYLGYGRSLPDEGVLKLIHQCMEEVEREAQPKSVSRRFALTAAAHDSLEFAGLQVRSRSLSRNLRGCEEVILFAATLGSGIDRLLGRYLRLNMAKAAVLQATAAEAIEAYCNSCQKQLEQQAAEDGYYLRPRFSPGYGDLSLEIQPRLLQALNTQRTIGLLLSEGGVMLPEKSVTAVMGLSRENLHCLQEGCEACSKKDCAYRRESSSDTDG